MNQKIATSWNDVVDGILPSSVESCHSLWEEQLQKMEKANAPGKSFQPIIDQLRSAGKDVREFGAHKLAQPMAGLVDLYASTLKQLGYVPPKAVKRRKSAPRIWVR